MTKQFNLKSLMLLCSFLLCTNAKAIDLNPNSGAWQRKSTNENTVIYQLKRHPEITLTQVQLTLRPNSRAPASSFALGKLMLLLDANPQLAWQLPVANQQQAKLVTSDGERNVVERLVIEDGRLTVSTLQHPTISATLTTDNHQKTQEG